MRRFLTGLLVSSAFLGCGDDSSSEAERRGIGAECKEDGECREPGQRCLAFKGGYCGISDCETDAGCPSGAACVSHTDGTNYCFLICRDKLECNRHRSEEFESNCSANVTFTDGRENDKACVPPSGS